jgi:hypothetical protein
LCHCDGGHEISDLRSAGELVHGRGPNVEPVCDRTSEWKPYQRQS